MELTKKDYRRLYGDMWLIRLFEGRLKDLFAEGVIPGFVHLGIGQEATMAGTCFFLDDGDVIGATHREHGVLLNRGVDPKRVMAEIFGKETGCSRGRGGSMHTAELSKGCLGNGAILGTYQTIINGYAYAHKVRNNKKVAVTMFGDGQSNRGDVYEGMNFEATWNLPTIVIIQNNGYAMSVPRDKQMKLEDMSKRAVAFDMPGERVDGNDLMAVLDACGRAVERAREGGGPTLLVYETYRWRGHFEGDPQPYRDRAEVDDQIKNNDPIKRFEEVILEKGVLTREEMDEIKAEQKAIVDEAEEFARTSPDPDPADLMDGIYYYEEGSETNA